MTHYSESPLSYVELYDGVQHRYQLRVLYQVQLYEPFPTHSYISSDWITLDGSGDELSSDSSESLTCPEGTTTFASRYKLRGKVLLASNIARIQMEYFDGRPYKFNGEYRLVRAQETAARVVKTQAEAKASALASSIAIYCDPVADSNGNK